MDFFEIVDTNPSRMAFLRKVNLDEVGKYCQLDELFRRLERVNWYGDERHVRQFAARHEVAAEDALHDLGVWKAPHCAAEMPPWITELQPARQDRVQRGPRNHAKLPLPGHCTSQLPAGNPGTHPPLNQDRMSYWWRDNTG